MPSRAMLLVGLGRRFPRSVPTMLTERFARAIENASVLDRPADAGANLLNKLLKPGVVKDALSGTWLGHPAHPILVAVPIGAWVSSTVLDLVGGRSARPAARTLVGLGALAALPTAMTGASDWADTMGAERRLGFVHAMANYTALGLYAQSWRARGQGAHSRGVALSVLGSGVLGVGGWLGGHLAYARGVGVDTTAFLGAPQDWTDVAAEADLVEGEPLGVTLGALPVLLLRRGATLIALNDRCTHRGAPLHEGPIVDGCIECPWHGSRFTLTDGEVVRGPATRPQPSYEVRAESGRVLIRETQTQNSLRTNPVAAVSA